MRLRDWPVSIGLLLVACNTSSRRPPPETTITNSALPNSVLTPGDVLPVTKADICTPGYTKKVRDVPAIVKREVYYSYHRERREGVCCEIDHLIPLELGGSNRIPNLWPQLYDGDWNAREKDRLERRLHGLVCSGELDLETAQRAIASDWITAYKMYFVSESVGSRAEPR
jgi:hypothetical protein